jgi:histidine ammonia-lyase/phenylalanine ammonia-lyase
MEAVACRGARVELSPAEAVRRAIDRSRDVMLAQLDKGSPIHGVTTGVGDSARRQVGRERAAAMQRLLVRKCGCGSGPEFTPAQVRANCLSRGRSGVRPVLIERLLEMLNRDLLPLIPAQGSLGASGDLVPAS